MKSRISAWTLYWSMRHKRLLVKLSQFGVCSCQYSLLCVGNLVTDAAEYGRVSGRESGARVNNGRGRRRKSILMMRESAA